MKKNKKIRYWIPALLIMAAIFYFSHQPSQESAELSGGVSYRLVYGFNQITRQGWDDEMCRSYASMIDHPVRKAAHMTEYGILCISVLFAYYKGSRFLKPALFWKAAAISAAYAATDEFHQLFIPGRGGRITDVLIDGTGSLMGGFLFYLLLKCVLNQKAKKD